MASDLVIYIFTFYFQVLSLDGEMYLSNQEIWDNLGAFLTSGNSYNSASYVEYLRLQVGIGGEEYFTYLLSTIFTIITLIFLFILLFKLFKWLFTFIFKLFRLN